MNEPIIEHRACVVGDIYQGSNVGQFADEVAWCIKDIERGPINLARLFWVLETCERELRHRLPTVRDVTCQRCGMPTEHVAGCPLIVGTGDGSEPDLPLE